MITTAENIATMYGITREQCDEFAYNSQMRAAAATNNGYFKDEIIPVVIPATKKTPEIVFDSDEFLRPTTTMEGLANLKSVKPDGVTTAGNASGRNDGASMLLLMSEEKAKELGYTPYARVIMAGNSALDPKLMGLGPVKASLEAIKKAGLTVDDIDVWECNEAFAVQNLGVIKGIEDATGKKIDRERWNPNGGAISFGHPNGASGGRIAMFNMRELERGGGRYGLFTSCCGGGQGVSTIIENLRK
jgi:acetyl-CoA C-acetyltransferase